MPVPSAITELSQTAGSNYPAGSESPSTTDDYLRTYASYIAKLRDGQGFTSPVTLASATTTDIGGQVSNAVEISGTTTITSFGTNYSGPRFLKFTGALTLTHNATSLVLPTGANITTVAGDTCIAVPNQALNGWTVFAYAGKSGQFTTISGALNGTVGATTPSTGAFTSLSATGNISTSNSGAFVGVGTPATSYNVFQASGSTTATTYGSIANTGGTLIWGVDNSAGTAVSGGSAYGGFVGTTNSTTNLNLLIGGATKATLSTAGLAVTGNLSSTGGITNTAAASTNSTLTLSGSGAYSSSVTLNGAGGGSGFVNAGSGVNLSLNAPTGQHVYQSINNVAVTDVTSTGLTVTGTIDAGGNGLGPSGGFASKTTVAGNQNFTGWNTATSGTRYFAYFGTEGTFTSRGAIVYNSSGYGFTTGGGTNGMFLDGSGNASFTGSLTTGGAVITTGRRSNSIIETGTSNNWFYLGTLTFDGVGARCTIRIPGSQSYSSGNRDSSETVLHITVQNDSTLYGNFYGITSDISAITGFAWKVSSGTIYQIWARMQTFMRINPDVFGDVYFTPSISDTGSTTQPAGSTLFESRWQLQTYTTAQAANGVSLVADNDGYLTTYSYLGLGATPSTPFDISLTAGAGTPRVRVNQTADNPWIDMQRWSGAGTTYYGTRLRNVSGNLAFDVSNVANIGSQTWTQAVTLDTSGNLLVANTAASGTPAVGVCVLKDFTAGSASGIAIGHQSGTGSGAVYANFAYNAGAIGSITQNGTTAVAYNTTSDHRLKENVRPADAARFMDIEFVDFEWTDGRHDCGVIAHQLASVYPDLVLGEKDATEVRTVEITPAVPEVKDEDGNVITPAIPAVTEEQTFPVYQQVNYIGLIGRMGTRIQSLQRTVDAQAAMLAAMEARIAALEAK